MKLSAREAQAFFARPDARAAGLLIHGDDPMRVAMKRQQVLAALVGPQAEEEMRLTRIGGAELRKEPALLFDAVKAQGFFPGPRAVLVQEATDGLASVIGTALGDWRSGDAQIVATAALLPARSALRKLFEGARSAYCATLYSDAMGRDEIEAELTRAGLGAPERDTMAALEALAKLLTPGDFRQTLEKIALYKLDDPAPLTPAEVSLNAPVSVEGAVDAVFDVLAEGRQGEIAPLMRRLAAQGVQPVALLIRGMRHFRTLYAVASAPGGASQGIAKLRPPVFGPRRDSLLRQAQRWSPDRLEAALTVLMDADLALRSAGQKAPAMALVERAFVRLAYMARM